MRISVLTVGDELLRGKTINTNAAFLGENLLRLGLEVHNSLTIADCPDAIRGALDWLLPQSDLIITSGGLGSTGDDLTRDTIAAYLGLPLEINAEAEADIRKFLLRRGQHCHEAEKVMRQAMAPASCEIFTNETGSAPGLWINVPGTKQHICMLPGPPIELHPMVVRHLLPRLATLGGGQVHSCLYYVAHAPELWVEEQVRRIIADSGLITPAYCAEYDHVKLFLSGRDKAELQRVAGQVEQVFGTRLLRAGCSSMAEEMVVLLREQCLHLATAESCTGGLIAAAITDIAGSSDVFTGSVVAYSNQIKEEQLDVPVELLEKYGAVSEECVTAMVNNLCCKFRTDAGIAVSGIAGPGGGSEDKPVGLVFCAVKLNDKLLVRRNLFPGNRDSVRRRSVAAAWYELRQLLLVRG